MQPDAKIRMDKHSEREGKLEREREREREKKGERERASPTRFLLRRAPKMLPAGDRVTAHHCEGIRGGK